MRRRRGDGPRPRAAEATGGALDRARTLLLQLETGARRPVTAAEELDRLQPALARAGQLESIRERVALLCHAWADPLPRDERGRAWLTLIGGFRLDEHADGVEALVAARGYPAALREAACRVLPHVAGAAAGGALLRVLREESDPRLRVAAAEAAAELGDPGVGEALRGLLDEELPPAVWHAVSAAVERMR